MKLELSPNQVKSIIEHLLSKREAKNVTIKSRVAVVPRSIKKLILNEPITDEDVHSFEICDELESYIVITDDNVIYSIDGSIVEGFDFPVYGFYSELVKLPENIENIDDLPETVDGQVYPMDVRDNYKSFIYLYHYPLLYAVLIILLEHPEMLIGYNSKDFRKIAQVLKCCEEIHNNLI